MERRIRAGTLREQKDVISPDYTSPNSRTEALRFTCTEHHSDPGSDLLIPGCLPTVERLPSSVHRSRIQSDIAPAKEDPQDACGTASLCLAIIICNEVIEDKRTNNKTLVGLFSRIGTKAVPCVHPRMFVMHR